MASVRESGRAAVEAVWKREAARLIGGLARLVRDVDLAEDLAQEALVVALERWPSEGLPDNPGAWLMTTAKRRALNELRRTKVSLARGDDARATDDRALGVDEVVEALEAGMDEDVQDDVLRLLFAACHPSLPSEARVALTLRVVGGLSTEEIARAFLVPAPTMAQRIVRAKKAATGALFEVPRGDDLGVRLGSVMEVVYLVFNEGYAASAGSDIQRPTLVREALRLGELLATLAPDEPEAAGLLALMRLTASRAAARTGLGGEPVLLERQDRGLWDRSLIDAGLTALDAARAAGDEPGPYRLQAEIAACHACALRAADTDWARIAALYGELASITGSPIVELNRAVAVSRAEGPEVALELLDQLAREPALARYHLLPSARAEMLERLGRFDEACAEFARAAELTQNERQRERLSERARDCGARRSGPPA